MAYVNNYLKKVLRPRYVRLNAGRKKELQACGTNGTEHVTELCDVDRTGTDGYPGGIG